MIAVHALKLHYFYMFILFNIVNTVLLLVINVVYVYINNILLFDILVLLGSVHPSY